MSTNHRFGHLAARSLAGLLVVLGAVACSSDDELGTSTEALTSSRWVIPAEVKAIGATVRVSYDAAGAWDPGACGAGLLPGSKALGDYLTQQFPAISSVGGFSCRPNTANTSRMSEHGTGRAIDVMVPDSSSEGDEIANWLVTNAQSIGVQMIIWNRVVWRGNGSNEKSYGGPHPHNDHLHVELNNEAGNRNTPFFQNGMTGTPVTPGGVPTVDPLNPAQPYTPNPANPYNPGDPTVEDVDPYNPNPGYNPGGYPTQPTDPNNPYGVPTPPSGQPGSIPTLPGGGGIPTQTTPGGLPTGPTTTTPAAPAVSPPPAAVAAPPQASYEDNPSGVPDSTGAGVRTPKRKNAAKQQVESCSASASLGGGSAPSSSVPLLGVALAAVLVRRRRRSG